MTALLLRLLGLAGGDERERCVALAGVFQAAALVQRIARTGSAPPQPLRVSLNSVLRQDAGSPLAVYGELDDLELGFETLVRQLGREPGSRDLEITRYVSNLVVLERNLARNPELLQRIAHGVRTAAALAEDTGSAEHAEVVERLASVYRSTLSTLTPRIMVSGEPAYLGRDENAQLIRALLLAAVRSVVLWRQLGGSRRRLLFTRRSLLQLGHAALQAAAVDDDARQR